MRKSSGILSLIFWGAAMPAQAVRTAVFPVNVHARTAIWLDQARIFDHESAADKERPIWIHGGDSISTGWANGPSIRQAIARAERGPIPAPKSVGDYIAHLPDAAQTWYAGTNLQGGLLGALDRLGKPWVVISTALAGTTITPKGEEDPLAYMLQVREPERVRLVTFSLGNNDVCDGLNPSRVPEFRAKLRSLRERFAQARIVPFLIADVHGTREAILARLAQLPPSPGRDRVEQYCRAMWEFSCPNAGRANSNADEIRNDIMTTLNEEVGPVFDLMGPARSTDPLDLLSSDCFHPSGAMEGRILAPLQAFIASRLTD